jgi:hypothetical protein
MNRMFLQFKLFLALGSIFALNGCSVLQRSPAQVEAVNEESIISQPLLKILEITGVKHDGTLDSIVAETQKTWLRKPGQERWQMEKKYEGLRDQLEPYFNEMGLLEEVKPSQKEYVYVILNGSTAQRLRARLAYLLDLYKAGYRYNILVCFIGERPLDPQLEPASIFFDRTNGILPIRADYKEPAELPKTEADFAKMLIDQAEFPAGFKDHVRIEFAVAPMQQNPDGTARRPNTGDTVNAWMAQHPKPGTVLSISNQPYVSYQHKVLQTLLPDDFKLETVGSAVDTVEIDGKKQYKIDASVFLDNLARLLYQEKAYLATKAKK